jgi:D-beta-D-heptose 7-phosphate kinase/D-beta-D-heptose 1-phosphate adenosyltransferase
MNPQMQVSVEELIHSFSRRRILVIGDVMLDEYLWGHIERISPEAPVPIFRLLRRDPAMGGLGGAGNVMKNLASLGAQVVAFGVIGEDDTGRAILAEMGSRGIDPSGMVLETGRVSTKKSRLMSDEHGQQVLRFDEETQAPIHAQTEDALIAALQSWVGRVNAVLCSDYLKGVLTSRVLSAVFQSGREMDTTTVVAPKDSDPNKYCHANVLVPNARELAQLTQADATNPYWLSRAAEKLIRGIEINSLLVTRGSEGMSLFESEGNFIRRLDIPTVARSVFDVTGAGDTVISVFTLAIASGAKNEDAARLANIAAGIVVGQRGTICLTPEDLLQRVREDATRASSAITT